MYLALSTHTPEASVWLIEDGEEIASKSWEAHRTLSDTLLKTIEEELTNQVKAGNRAVMFYLVQREDCAGFAVASDIDAVYAEGLAGAIGAGVEVYCYKCKLTPKQISLDTALSFER